MFTWLFLTGDAPSLPAPLAAVVPGKALARIDVPFAYTNTEELNVNWSIAATAVMFICTIIVFLYS
jgi:hypothetical protein